MKERLLEQIGKELKTSAWVDMVITVVAVTVTLIFFAVAAVSAGAAVSTDMPALSLGDIFGGGVSPAAPEYEFNVAPTIICFVTLAIIIVINTGAITVLLKNKNQRAILNEGLARLLKDETVDQYNDGAIYRTYETRYTFFTMILGSVAALSVIVPIIIYVNQVVTKL